jgi:prepilin-type processing-associated H-X9-DG protein
VRYAIILLLTIALWPAMCHAQALADRIPADAILYAGWNGVDAPGPGFDQSHLKAILAVSDFQRFIHESLPSIAARIAAQDVQAGIAANLLTNVAGTLWHHPTALYFGGIDIGNAPQPIIKLALLCDAGADAPLLATQFQLILHGPLAGSPFQCETRGNLVILSAFAFPDSPTATLAQSSDFKTALAGMGDHPFTCFYLDGRALGALADKVVATAPPQVQTMWPKIRDGLGLPGLRHVVATSGFDGRDWGSRLFVDAPAPRSGLLGSMIGSAPLSNDLLRRIPITATFAGASSLDLSAMLNGLRAIVRQFNPDAASEIDAVIQQIDGAVGFDIDSQFLAALGTQWGIYQDPTTAGSGMLGMTLINRPRDAAQLESSHQRLEAVLNPTIKGLLKATPFTIEFRDESIGGNNVHYLATPLVTPSWVIRDGTLYAALYPQIVVSAANRRADAPSILDNPSFVELRRRLDGPAGITSMQFLDLPKLAPESYQSLLMISRLWLGAGDLLGVRMPPLVLPPLDTMTAELEPAGGIGWADDAGFHARSIEPFPGSVVIGTASSFGPASIGEMAMVTSILLPSLNRSRETAKRVQCASNLRQIGSAILLYSNEHQGSFPPDLATLVEGGSIPPAALVCPSTNTAVPADWGVMTAADRKLWITENSDYVYVGAGLKVSMPPEVVVAYDKPDNHSGDGMNMLFADGHVEFDPMDQADQTIAKSKQLIQGN